jgi:two-component system CheB/CheR fusion protein
MQGSDIVYREIIQALPEHIAVVDRHGQIVLTNQAWDDFAAANGAAGDPTVAAGANYLDVCKRSMDLNDLHAARALEGIEAVLNGRSLSFAMDYPCHSPNAPLVFHDHRAV